MWKNHIYLAWLSMAVQQWRKDNNYKIVEEVVAVKRDGDRICTARSEKAYQATLLAVDELSHLSFDLKRGTFTKKQLSSDPEKSRDGGCAVKAPVRHQK